MYFNMEMLGHNYNKRYNEVVRHLYLRAESPFVGQFLRTVCQALAKIYGADRNPFSWSLHSNRVVGYKQTIGIIQQNT